MTRHCILLILLLGSSLVSCYGDQLNFSCTPSGTIEVFSPIECTVKLDASKFHNPFDFDEVRVYALDSSKSFKTDGFYYGSNEWHLRYTPLKEGELKFTICVDESSSSICGDEFQVSVSGVTGHGFVRVSPNKNYFVFDDGTPYYPVGENICWGNSINDFEKWMSKMSAAGGNYMRIWLGVFDFLGLETNQTGLGRYSLSSASHVDSIISLAEKYDIYILFCIDSFNELRIQEPYPMWQISPYNKENGGILDTPSAFFTDNKAISYYERRARFIVARWGYSPRVLAWELWNEVDLTDKYNSGNIGKWHGTVGDFYNSIDPNKHMLTTSMSSIDDPKVQGAAQMSYVQTHRYNSDDMGWDLRNVCNEKHLTYPDRPHVIGEYGLGDPTSSEKDDPTGIYLHNGMLVSIISGAAGTAMTWWWDNYIDPQDLYSRFTSSARLQAKIDFTTKKFIDLLIFDNSEPYARVHGLLGGSTSAILWVQNKNNTWALQNTGMPLSMISTEFYFVGLSQGAYVATWYETTKIEKISSYSFGISSPVDRVTLSTPQFKTDVIGLVTKE